MVKNKRLGDPLSRLLSYLIDSLIIFVVSVLFMYFLKSGILLSISTTSETSNLTILSVFSHLFALSYFTYFFGNESTPGMNVLNLKLVKTSGDPPTYFTGLIRYIGMIVSLIVATLGYVWILIDKNKQAWHDKMAGTLVVKNEF